MSDRRSRMFWLGALALAGVGVSMMSCAVEDEIDGKKRGTDESSNIETKIDDTGDKIAKGVPAICRNSKKCLDASECIGDAAFLACRCVTEQRCSDDPQCNGINDSAEGSTYTCNYTCGQPLEDGTDTCNWNVCRNSKACTESSTDGCTLRSAQDRPDDDDDNDHISNGDEISAGYDPCNEDMDGDGVLDGDEDLDGDGVIHPEFGEYDPRDPNDHPNSSNGEAKAREKVCKKEILNGNKYTFSNGVVAGFTTTSPTYNQVRGDSSDTDIVSFDDSATGVSGLYYLDTPKVGKVIISSALKNQFAESIKQIFEESNFETPVPLDSWNGYKKELQIIPNHSVQRSKYAIHLADGAQVTPKMVRDALASAFGNQKVTIAEYNESEKCSSGQISLYLARSNYAAGNGSLIDAKAIYSFGIACKENVTKKGSIEMDDIISGTMVAPGDYEPFRNFICQTEGYGKTNGMIDFIWLVDNSGSMADEQENVSATADIFMDKLATSGVDYRIAVAFTDSYLLDEAAENEGYHNYWKAAVSGTTGDMPYVFDNGTRYHTNLTGNGYSNVSFINGKNEIDEKDDPESVKFAFKQMVTEFQQGGVGCNRNDFQGSAIPTKNKNICGSGYEDGLKSVEYVLKKLAQPTIFDLRKAIYFDGWEGAVANSKEGRCAIAKDKVPHCFDDNLDEASCYQEVLSYYKNIPDADKDKVVICLNNVENITLRDNALKYIIWITDENSRQFKELPRATKNIGFAYTPSNKYYPALPICRSGYEITGPELTEVATNPFKQAFGRCFYDEEAEESIPDYTDPDNNTQVTVSDCYTDDTLSTQKACQPYYTDRSTDEGKKAITESTKLPELADKYKATYNIISYYLASYVQYAGTGGIAGFAIVGDDKSNGGACEELKGNSAMGANYGYDYILTARYLGALEKNGEGLYIDSKGNYNFSGKEGGYGSICNSDYEGTVTALLDDAIGRVAAHNLIGYPISSTITVSIKNPTSDNATTLYRNESSNGWSYDASQNAIILSNVARATEKSYLAIAYVIWKKNLG